MKSSSYVRVNDEMTFPNPYADSLENLTWRLGYDTNLILTQEERFFIRSFIGAYCSILTHEGRNLEDTRKLIRDIRKVINE